MTEGLRGRDFLTLMDLTAMEISGIIDTAIDLKKRRAHKEPHACLLGRTYAMIFEKRSTRTRTSFQAAAAQLGAQSFYMRPDEMQLGRGEPVKDTARVIDRYCDGLFIRTYDQSIVEEFADYMEHPVINALTDQYHPCQGLADLMTIKEQLGTWAGIKLVYVGDVFNVSNTLLIAGAKLGFDVVVAAPKGHDPDPALFAKVGEMARESGAALEISHDLSQSILDADVVYANTWHSMGRTDVDERRATFRPFQINREMMDLAKDEAIFMHCLPGYRGEEMTDEIIEGTQSVVWEEAENRMHTEKAILKLFSS
ncbi:ornithine carbamoyltransferase [Candidatus Bipolaricaulota bacterium]